MFNKNFTIDELQTIDKLCKDKSKELMKNYLALKKEGEENNYNWNIKDSNNYTVNDYGDALEKLATISLRIDFQISSILNNEKGC